MSIINLVTGYFRTYTPEILLGIGGASIVGGTAFSIAGGMRAARKVDEYRAKLAWIEDVKGQNDRGELDESTPYTEDDVRYDTRLATRDLVIGVGASIGPGILMVAGGLICCGTAVGVANRRMIAMAGVANTALTLLDKESNNFREYREKVRKEFGEDKDLEFLTGAKSSTESVEVVGEDGKKRKIKKKVLVPSDENGFSTSGVYQFVFGPTIGNADKYGSEVASMKNYNWSQNAGLTSMFLNQAQGWANLQLKTRGYIFLDEILRSLGMPDVDFSHVVGWMNDGDGDCEVSFRIQELGGGIFLLDFNCDGKIYGKISEALTKKALEEGRPLFKM